MGTVNFDIPERIRTSNLPILCSNALSTEQLTEITLAILALFRLTGTLKYMQERRAVGRA